VDVNENFMIMVNMGIVFSFFTFLVKTFVEWKKLRYKSQFHHQKEASRHIKEMERKAMLPILIFHSVAILASLGVGISSLLVSGIAMALAPRKHL